MPYRDLGVIRASLVLILMMLWLPTVAAEAPPLCSNTLDKAPLVVIAPQCYQVFQRRTAYDGVISVSGRVRPPCDRVEARVTGMSLRGPLPESWVRMPMARMTQAFAGELPCAAGGWYVVEVRAVNGSELVGHVVIDNVGMGEVFVVAGQSNSTNSGEGRLTPATGMVASFGGETWQPADDPQPGVHDKSQGGSCWPAFGDALYRKYRVPIGLAVTGHGGTSVTQWQPGSELYSWMLQRMLRLGPRGYRAVLWHQGESDAGKPTEEYMRLLSTTILAAKQDTGWEFPWFIAQATYHSPTKPYHESIRNAQANLWALGIALEGPDTDRLIGENRDQQGNGIHFSQKGLVAHGTLWAKSVAVYLDSVLAQDPPPAVTKPAVAHKTPVKK